MKYIPALTIFMICLVAFNANLAAALGVGESLPHSLAAQDQNGDRQSFDTLSGEKGAVLFFVRSADWCPFCQAQILDIQEQAAKITDKGYGIVIISYDSVDRLSDFAQKYDFSHTLLSDSDSEMIKAFGILNEEIDSKSPYYGIPHPTIYIINAQGVISAVFSAQNYKSRADVDQIAALL